jgi:hypothetical protein
MAQWHRGLRAACEMINTRALPACSSLFRFLVRDSLRYGSDQPWNKHRTHVARSLPSQYS